MLKTPPLQTATATIDTLCSRLQSATLLEDRRGAILGLRSFAKQYPASVASGSLRELIAILKKDGLGQTADERKSEEGGGDVDTIRLVLETLLMLFNPDENSPEAGEEIGFFMADEFSMRQDNISMLLSLLDPTSPYADYYSRLYSVQILSGICAARPERLQETVLSAPLGVSRLVGVLDDGRDAVRNAGLLLLVDLTGGANEDLRKIVAFEDVFVKVFALIRTEGGLADAGITAQDCLSLLANLVRGSSSNQTMFRESGCVAQLCQLLTETFPPDEPEAAFLAQSREKGGWGLLQLLRLFLTPGETSTAQNQQAFFRAGAAQILSDLGFTGSLPTPIRIAAFKCAADLVQRNAPLQEAFAALTIILPSTTSSAPPPLPSRSHTPAQTNGTRSAKGSTRPSADQPRVYIIEGLLDLALLQTQAEQALRAAACNLIQAYLAHHDRIKAHFLQRAMAGHSEHEDAANVLTTLLHPGADPTSIVFATWIVQDLVLDSPESKTALANVREGNEAEGEDVITAIQAIGSQLEAALQVASVDERVAASLSSLLSALLWEFAEGVDDLLAEGSSLVQALIGITKSTAEPIVRGTSASLLGTIYEFSTKDSPISRRTLAPLLNQKLGRSNYLDAMLSLRRDPAVRDYGLSEAEDAEGSLSPTFIDFFMTEYSRLRKAIDKDPGVEVLPASAAEAGVDRDILDSLRQEVRSANDARAQSQAEALAASQSAEQEKLGREKELQGLLGEVERLRKINQAMQSSHENELQGLKDQHTQQSQNLNSQHQRAITEAKHKVETQSRQVIDGKDAEIARLAAQTEQRVAEAASFGEIEKVEHGNTKRQLQEAQRLLEQSQSREREVRDAITRLEREHAELGEANESLQTRASEAETKFKSNDERLAAVQQQMETANSQVAALRQQHAELEEQLKGKDNELRLKDEELETERSGFGDLEKELEAAKASQTELRKELEAAREAQAEGEASQNGTSDQIAEMEKQLGTSKAEVDSLKADLEKAKKGQKAQSASKGQDKDSGANGSKKVKDLEKAKADAEKQLADLQKKADVSGKLLETLKEQSKTAQAALDEAKKDRDAAKSDLEAARESLDAAQEGEKSAKEELESMLLVMGDIEAKRDSYRAKVKELGGEVSDDDDGEDEDGEDENEEDDVD